MVSINPYSAMKKLLLFSVLVLIGLTLNAQHHWSFGLDVEVGRVGVSQEQTQAQNFSSSAREYRSHLSPGLGMSVGIWTERKLSHRLGLRFGVNYAFLQAFSQNEHIYHDNAGNMTFYGSSRLVQQQTALRLPVEGKLYLGSADQKYRVFISLGVQARYLFAQREFTENYYGGIQQEVSTRVYAEQIDLERAYYRDNRFRTALVTGLGVSSERLTFSLQRTFSWSDRQFFYEIYYDPGCFGPVNLYYPGHGNSGVPQLDIMSLRIAYQLF